MQSKSHADTRLITMPHNGPQVAEGGYTLTFKRRTEMDNETNIPNEEHTGRLQQPAVMESGCVHPFDEVEYLEQDIYWCTKCLVYLSKQPVP